VLGFERLRTLGDPAALTAAALAEAVAGRLTPTIGQTFPLAEAAAPTPTSRRADPG